MRLALWILKYLFYIFSALAFLMATPHKLTVLLFIKDVFFCVGWSHVLNGIFEYLEYKIEYWSLKKMIGKNINDPYLGNKTLK